jgi:hypothetical protein
VEYIEEIYDQLLLIYQFRFQLIDHDLILLLLSYLDPFEKVHEDIQLNEMYQSIDPTRIILFISSQSQRTLLISHSMSLYLYHFVINSKSTAITTRDIINKTNNIHKFVLRFENKQYQ